MNLNCRLNIFVVVVSTILTLSCEAYQSGKGKFVSYNGNRYTEGKSMDDNNTKLFLSLNRNRPPAHDTPASPCSCSKFWQLQIYEFHEKWILFMQIDPTFSFTNANAARGSGQSFSWPWSRKFFGHFFGRNFMETATSKIQMRNKIVKAKRQYPQVWTCFCRK